MIHEPEVLDGKLFPFGVNVVSLPAYHAHRAGGFGEDGNQLAAKRRGDFFPGRQDFKGRRQKAVACHGGHAGAVDFVIRQLASAIVVVIHGREVVMDEGVGMDALDGAGDVYILRPVLVKKLKD